MGNTTSSLSSSELEYIRSPKQHCPVKPFPIPLPKPIPLKIKKQSNILEKNYARSLPCSFEDKDINKNNESETVGRHLPSKGNDRYYFARTYIENSK